MPHRVVAAFLLLVIACTSPAAGPEPLPGTKLLDMQGDLASQMVAGIDRFLLRETEESVERRAALWKRDFSSPENYAKSVEPNRQHLRRMLGVENVSRSEQGQRAFEIAGHTVSRVVRAMRKNDDYSVVAVRWPVLPGVSGEGILISPLKQQEFANCIVIPDADQTPEMLAGPNELKGEVPAAS
jgi:hypothetical protein